jgi:hypothetical protein
MAEGVLPPPLAANPVLDWHERQQLQACGFDLPAAGEQYRQEARTFALLLQTATESVTLSYPRLQGREPQLPSPYLAWLGLEAAELPPAPIASPEEQRQLGLRQPRWPQDSVLPQAAHAWAVERHREGN